MKDQPFTKPDQIPKAVLQQISARLAVHYSIMPLTQENGILHLAAPETLSRQAKEELRVVLGRDLEFVAMSRIEIEALIATYYGVGAEVIEALTQNKTQVEDVVEFEVIDRDQKEDTNITRLVNELFMDAINLRASDIHIEPFENRLRVRYRVDGLLQDTEVSGQIHRLSAHLISRIKIMAKLDIGEKRLPQDGRIKVRLKEAELDLRVSVLPSSYGEAIVIRILKPLELLDLIDLGFDASHLTQIRQLLKKPHGVILITGPTGSGKTTTLYSCLRELNQTERKIITVEDPIEYKLPGVIQTQVNPKIDFTFARALRSILRHDPDCIMVGEIRDSETAEIAIRSALTGHLVFSTLHTNDAPSAITRLIEIGVEPYLVAASVQAVMAQRLVRKFCLVCQGQIGAKCKTCGGSGYYGRFAISELAILNDEIREMIVQGKTGLLIRQAAIQNGMLEMSENGKEKVRLGLTGEAEIRRVIG